MNLSDMPLRVAIPFANAAGAGYIRPVPVPSQAGGAASFTDGFPPDTFTPLSGGGAYVNGEDVNGILNYVTKWTRWQSAGGAAVYNSTFATAIGGYPRDAVLASSAGGGKLWQNQVDGNLTDPDGGSAAGWTNVGPTAADLATARGGTDLAEFINSAVLHDFFTPNTYTSGSALTLGPLKIQWGQDNTTTNNVAATYHLAYPEPFGGPAEAAVAFRYDPSGRTYNQKVFMKTSRGDANGFDWKIMNGDSGDGSSLIYGFDWIAIGTAP